MLRVAIRQEAMRLDPFFLYPALNLSFELNLLGRSEEALTIVEKTLLVEPEAVPSLVTKAMVLIYLGRLREAAEAIEVLDKLYGEKKLPPVWFQIVKHAYLIQENNPAKIKSTLEEIRKTADHLPATGWELGNHVGLISPLLARHGHKDPAFNLGIQFSYEGSRPFPDYQKLKGDPRFEKLLPRSRAFLEEALGILGDARRRGEFPKYLEKLLEEILVKLDMKKTPPSA